MAELLPIRDPYAVIWVATYEPLIVEWVGYQGIRDLRDRLFLREVAQRQSQIFATPTVGRFNWSARDTRAGTAPVGGGEPGEPAASGRPMLLVPILGPAARSRRLPPQERQQRRRAIEEVLARPGLTPKQIFDRLTAANVPTVVDSDVRRELSPIGVAHLYRQLFFDAAAGIGPIEQAVAVAPGETLEITQDITRRRTVETVEEFGASETGTSELVETSTSEIAEQMQATMALDINMAMSASAEGTIGVASVGGSSSFDLGTSTSRSQDITKRTMLSKTRRTSQIVQRSYSFSVRTVTDFSDRSLVRRVIRNEEETPVNFALRRVVRKVRVKIQAVGPRLVWQVYICRPGQRLALSRLVMFREAEDLAPPDLPPNAPPKPQAVTESLVQTLHVLSGDVLQLSVPNRSGYRIASVTVDSLSDASPEKGPEAPSLTGDPITTVSGNETTPTVEFRVPIDPGTASVIALQFTTRYEPGLTLLQEWNDAVAAARHQWEAAQAAEQFERAKRLINAKLGVRPRPTADLRQEERYEMLNRMIGEAFGGGQSRGAPLPVEIEVFHRLFEINSLFYYVHPSWWQPRYESDRRPDYEITDESAAAPMGSSLGWLIQLDGDHRRNEFLNSPWLRVCIPIRPGRERQACEWLAEHIEGKRGFSLDPDHPMGKLLADIEARRAQEATAAPGWDYLTLDGEVAPDEQAAADAYPVIKEFDILQPTDGFVYEALTIES
jgi:hypothetical protein